MFQNNGFKNQLKHNLKDHLALLIMVTNGGLEHLEIMATMHILHKDIGDNIFL